MANRTLCGFYSLLLLFLTTYLNQLAEIGLFLPVARPVLGLLLPGEEGRGQHRRLLLAAGRAHPVGGVVVHQGRRGGRLGAGAGARIFP